MGKYTYYVFIDRKGKRDVQPVYTGKRTAMDAQATQFGHDNGYNAAIGPFRTLRGANYMAAYGANNPHCHTVNDAERLAKELKAG